MVYFAEGLKKAESKQVSPSPDVLSAVSRHTQPEPLATCDHCAKWQNKYSKAKQSLAATLEKLQAASLRREKMDRGLKKELGKTHTVLLQTRGIIEQVTQVKHS